MSAARVLRDRGYMVVAGRVNEDPPMLARVREARAVVANAGDHANASFVMLVREHGYTGPLYALGDDPLYRAPMLRIGATEVFTPSHVLGAALASRASVRISPPAEGMHLLGTSMGIGEFRVHPSSPLAGRLLGELRLPGSRPGELVGRGREAVVVEVQGRLRAGHHRRHRLFPVGRDDQQRLGRRRWQGAQRAQVAGQLGELDLAHPQVDKRPRTATMG
jgi:Trk K+ transport system NAD-binding subunit